MAWELSYNDDPPPPVGSYHRAIVNRPANFARVGKTGTGTAADPWIIEYESSAGSAAKPSDPWSLSMRKAGADERDAYLILRIDGHDRPTDRPTVQDGVSGGGGGKKGVKKKGGKKKGGKKAAAKSGRGGSRTKGRVRRK